MIRKIDSILVFEYFTASGEKDKSIISEAEQLIFSLVEELSDYKIELVLNKSYESVVNDYDYVNPIFIDENIIPWLENNAVNFKKAIFIAAENDNNLYNITKILEDNNVKIYASSSEACFKTSDKYETYKTLLNSVPQPKSFKLKIDSKGYWKHTVKDIYKKWQAENHSIPLKLIMKPLNGVDCEDIVILEGINNLENIFPLNSEIIVQQFIEGKDISVSLISDGKKAIPLSLNEQFIELKDNKGTYLGGKLPYDSKYKNEAFQIASKAVESIDGVKGFVGADLIIGSDSIYLLEINSRFTTPYVGLAKISNLNISKSIVEILDGKIDIDDLKISLNGEVEFKKSGESLDIRRI